jgi:hypothetical protein
MEPTLRYTAAILPIKDCHIKSLLFLRRSLAYRMINTVFILMVWSLDAESVYRAL